MKALLNLMFILLGIGTINVFSQTTQLFIENKGQVLDFLEQAHPEVSHYYSTHNTTVYFQKDRLVYLIKDDETIDRADYDGNYTELEEAIRKQKTTFHRMDMKFVNALENPSIISSEKAQGVTHYYLNKRNGIRDVHSYKSITYKNVYPNIDVVFYSKNGGLKYDFVLHQGALIESIQLAFEGAKLAIKNGKLHLQTSLHEMVEEIPVSFIDGNESKKVDVNYILNANGTIGFKLKNKVNYTTLTIDPVLEWGSYFNHPVGGTNMYNLANHMDNDGNYFSYGMAQNAANTYPVTNPGSAYTSTAMGSADAYICKFNASRTLVWSTYIGGSGYDEIYDGDIITTQGTTLHIVGERITAGAPFTSGGGFYQSNSNRNFWARFNKNTGAMIHLTSLSGGYKPSIAVSNSGLVAISNDVYDSSNLPIINRSGAYNQATNGQYKDMGLMMFNASYTQIWGTYLGGTGSQENFMVRFDNNDNLYFVGETSTATNIVSLAGAYNKNTVGGGVDLMLGKFTSTGQLVWCTLFGGNRDEARRGQQGHGAYIKIHPVTQELVLAFNTTSNNLPLTTLAGAYNKGVPTHTNFGGTSGSFGNYAAFICKFSTAGALNYSTYYYTGTGGGDLIENISFGGCNKLYIGSAGDGTRTLTGASAGYNLLTGTGSGRAGYITMLNSDTYAFEWSSYMNPSSSSEANVAANVNVPRFYTMTTLYYNNLPTVDPGNNAYFEASNNAPTSASLGISQFHPSLPPDVDDVTACQGASTTLTVSAGMGAPYNWYSAATGGTPLHTGATYTVSPTSTVTYYVSSGTGMCESPREPVTITVSNVVAGSASVNVTSSCTATNVNLSLAGHNGSIQWQYSTNGGTTWTNITGATSTPYTYATVNSTTSFRAVVTASACTATSNVVTTTITTQVTPSVTISGTPTAAICAGTSVTFTATPTNGGTTPTYQWQVNGVNVAGATGSTFTSSTLPNGAIVTVIMTSNHPCSTTSTASASTSAITVTTQVTPSVTIAGTPTAAICSGTSVTFTATPTNGGTTPTYQWQVNGVNVAGATGSTFTSSTLPNGAIVTVVMTSNHPCSTTATASTSTSAITVTTQVTPSVTISGTPTAAICSGTSVTFTATPTNGGTTPTYQWQVNGVNVAGATGSTFTSSTLPNGAIVTVVMTSNHPCSTTSTASASTSAITVTTQVTPSVTIAGTPTAAICSGTSVTFTATPTNGGTTPTYQWQVNGVNVAGATGSTFTSSTLPNGAIVTVVMTSNHPCSTTATASTSTSAITVTTQVTPSVTISGTPTAAICAGTSVTFTATPTNGGTTPTYQWQVNGVNVAGATGSTFTSSTLPNGAIVTVIMTSNHPCSTTATASASTSAITVTTQVTPSVTIAGTPTAAICSGTSVTFTATHTNGGTTPTYQWQVNGVNVAGATGSTFTSSTLPNGAIVTVVMTSNHPCSTTSTASASTSAITVTTQVTPSVTIAGTPTAAICAGTSVTFTATPTNGGTTPTYQWQVNGVNVAGATGSTFTTTDLSTGDIVTVIMTSNDPCATTAIVNASTAADAIIVGDDEVPEISNCPADITIQVDQNCEALVSWDAPTATDNCGNVTLTSSHNSNTTFPLGTTIVTYTATDDAGNTSNCSFNVTVVDNTPPSIVNCPSDSVFTSTAIGCIISLPDFTADITTTDNCANSVTITQHPAPGTVLSPSSGSTTITITATDNAGNSAICTFNVSVNGSGQNANAGADNIIELCSNTTINLNSLLSNDAQPNGTWYQQNGNNYQGIQPTIALDGMEGQYNYIYVVSQCDSDTAYFQLHVTNAKQHQGWIINNLSKYCPKESKTINLNDHLIQSNSQGIWITNGHQYSPFANGTVDITAMSNGTYSFIYIIENGPCGMDSLNLTIEIACGGLDIPNYVTPDGDGVDDIFVITGIENFPDNELYIYNRWGALVFETTNYQNDWNGKSYSKMNLGGDDLPTGTYYYLLDTKTSEYGVIKGFIYLER